MKLKIKNLISNFSIKSNCEHIRQLKWKFLKCSSLYEWPCKGMKTNITNLERKLKKLDISLDGANNLCKYNNIKNKLDTIYHHIAESIRIRSKCNWYEQGGKSTISFNIRKNNEARKI